MQWKQGLGEGGEQESDGTAPGEALPFGEVHPWGRATARQVGLSLTGGGGSIEPPKTGVEVGERAQLTDTIITNEKKLRSRFWQGFCTSDFVTLLGTLKRQGLCSHPAHLWATSDFVPLLGTPLDGRGSCHTAV